MTVRTVATALAMLALLWCAGAAAVETRAGRFDSGAYFRIKVPDGWQPEDGLVIWNHGFHLDPPSPPSLGPLAPLQLRQGYAVAATSYSLNGWALFKTIGDLRDLVHRFERAFGVPDKIYLAGGSMGGLVSIQGLEAANLGHVVGVYSLCGALSGSRLWDGAVDIRLAYDAVCAGVEGAQIPGGAKGLPFRIPPDEYSGGLGTTFKALLGQRINACTGILKPAALRSPAQAQRLEALMDVLNVPNERFLLVVMGFATAGLSDLFYDPAKLGGVLGTSNVGVTYDNDTLNRTIARVDASPLGRLRLLTNYTPTGEVGDAKVLATHTDEDGLVPVESLRAYARITPDAAYAWAVVDEQTPSHCGFTGAEVVAGWNALTDWVENDTPEPDAAGLQRRCERLAATVLSGPCRYDTDPETGTFDSRIPPRDMPDYRVDAGIFGSWYNPEDPGEGWVIEYLGENRVLVYWFTYPPAGGAGRQLWLLGTGTIDGNTITARLRQPLGRVFGTTEPVRRVPWGEITFTFAAENGQPTRAVVRWKGPPAFGTGHETIALLAARGDPSVLGERSLAYRVSGSWFNKTFDGEGWHITVRENGTALVFWFTYGPGGHPAWLVGVGDVHGNVIQVDQMRITRGTHFGKAFEPTAVKKPVWGSLRFEFTGCLTGRVHFESGVPGFGSGTRPITRLTVPPDSACASRARSRGR